MSFILPVTFHNLYFLYILFFFTVSCSQNTLLMINFLKCVASLLVCFNNFTLDSIYSLSNSLLIVFIYLLFVFIFNYLCNLKIRIRMRGKEIFHSLFPSPNILKSLSWAVLKQEFRDFPQLCHIDVEAQGIGSAASGVEQLQANWHQHRMLVLQVAG